MHTSDPVYCFELKPHVIGFPFAFSATAILTDLTMMVAYIVNVERLLVIASAAFPFGYYPHSSGVWLESFGS